MSWSERNPCCDQLGMTPIPHAGRRQRKIPIWKGPTWILFGERDVGPDDGRTTTFSNGCLGSHSDEERSEMRYVVRTAKPRESSRI